jgi:hypothetical protein
MPLYRAHMKPLGRMHCEPKIANDKRCHGQEKRTMRAPQVRQATRANGQDGCKQQQLAD